MRSGRRSAFLLLAGCASSFEPVVQTSPSSVASSPVVTPSSQVGMEEQFPIEMSPHIMSTTRANYKTNPPTSGPHYSRWATWGYHEEMMLPETWVHNLEHGGVVVLYDCTQNCSEQKSVVGDFVGHAPKEANLNEVKIVGTEDTGMGHNENSWGPSALADGGIEPLLTKPNLWVKLE